MALNAKTENDDDSECRNWEVMTTLNAKLKIVMALNAKTKNDDGSERQTE